MLEELLTAPKSSLKVKKALDDRDRYIDMLTAYTKELQERAGDFMLPEFSQLRGFNMDTIKEEGIFYVNDATEMLLPKYFNELNNLGVISETNKKPIFHNRWVMPIKDVDGRVLNLVGYSNTANERYLYGTAKYYRRRETLYGLENLDLAYKLGFAIITEGITDTICVRNLGYKNCFANCGTHESSFIIKQLNRCEHGVIKIPDRDKAGARLNKKWKFLRSAQLNVFIKYKDIDEMCRDSAEMAEIVKEYIDACIEWILQDKHRGFDSEKQVVTIV